MNFSRFALLCFLPLTGALLTNCRESEPNIQPKVVDTQDIIYQLGMQGYADMPTVVGRFGIAASEADALRGKAIGQQATITWPETKGGKETKQLILAAQPKGAKQWVFLSTHTKPVGTQAIKLNWLISKSLVLNAKSSDTLVIQEYTVE